LNGRQRAWRRLACGGGGVALKAGASAGGGVAQAAGWWPLLLPGDRLRMSLSCAALLATLGMAL